MNKHIGRNLTNCDWWVHSYIFPFRLAYFLICRELSVYPIDHLRETYGVALLEALLSYCFYFVLAFIDNYSYSLVQAISRLSPPILPF